MARRPSLFVRALSMDEDRKLQRITRTARDPVRLRRAIVVMMSGQGHTVRDITSSLQVSEDYVRDVIHAFNERGFAALDPKWSGGPRKKIGDRIREWICLIARTSPTECGLAGFSTWSLTKLREYLLAEGIVAELSRETLRRILRAGGVSWQTTTTWKASTDPDFIPRMRRVLDLYDSPPADGRVVCVDEFGPLNLQPPQGQGLAAPLPPTAAAGDLTPLRRAGTRSGWSRSVPAPTRPRRPPPSPRCRGGSSRPLQTALAQLLAADGTRTRSPRGRRPVVARAARAAPWAAYRNNGATART